MAMSIAHTVCGYRRHGLCSVRHGEEKGRGPKPPAKVGRAEMTKTRDQEEERCTFLGPACSNRASVSRVRPAPTKLWNSCPLPRPLGRTIPGSGTHREPPTEGSTMRLVKLTITQPPAWLARRKEKAVISGLMPCERSQGSISGNRALGNPLNLHSDTLRGSRPNRRANALVPPRASIHSAAVEQVFIPPSYPNGSDFVNNRDKENERICAVVPVSPDCG
jgi:hypothetical protein